MSRPITHLGAAAGLAFALAGSPGIAAEPTTSGLPQPVSLFQQSAARNPAAAAVTAGERSEPAVVSGSAAVERAQSLLVALGFDAGTVDGRMGPQTRAAIRAFQEAQGAPADGLLDRALLSALVRENRAAAPQVGEQNAPATEAIEAAPVAAPGFVSGPTHATETIPEPSPRHTVGLISAAEAATPTEPLPEMAVGEARSPAARQVPGYLASEHYGLDDAVAESWAIFTSLSAAMLDLVEQRVAELTR